MATEKSPANAPKNGTASRVAPVQRFKNRLELEAEMDEQSDETASISDVILERMANAESIDELFAAQDISLPAGKDMQDMEFEIRSFQVRKGDPQYSDNSVGYYYIIEATNLDTGADVQFATGAFNILALLMNLRERGALPVRVVIRGKATAGGTLLTMKQVGPRTVSA